MYESDGIKEYYKIAPIIFTDKKKNLENTDIFILQYLPEGIELCLSYEKIENNEIKKGKGSGFFL